MMQCQNSLKVKTGRGNSVTFQVNFSDRSVLLDFILILSLKESFSLNFFIKCVDNYSTAPP